MTRFALTVTIVMAGLTILAIGVIASVDDTAEDRLLTAEDFRAIGLRPMGFEQEEMLFPGGEMRRRYSAGIGPRSDAGVEVRLGAPRTSYADQLALETREAARASEEGEMHAMIEEQWGATSAFVVRRVQTAANESTIEVVLWALEGSSIIVTRVRHRGVPESDRTQRLHQAELHARSLATLAIDHLIELRNRRITSPVDR